MQRVFEDYDPFLNKPLTNRLSSGLVWGDAATAAHQEASLSLLAGPAPPAAAPAAASPLPSPLATLGRRLVRGGLRLAPTSDWLWSVAGVVAGADDLAGREYCWSRALQLNPKRAATWAALGRMYAQAGAGEGSI